MHGRTVAEIDLVCYVYAVYIPRDRGDVSEMYFRTGRLQRFRDRAADTLGGTRNKSRAACEI
jgi:hypothetical protein